MDDVAHPSPSLIRCEIGADCGDVAAHLLHAIVHHQCERADVDVEFVDTVEAATAEVLHDLARGFFRLSEVVVDPGYSGLDIALAVTSEDAAPHRAFVAGTVASATFDDVWSRSDGVIRLRRRFPTVGAS